MVKEVFRLISSAAILAAVIIGVQGADKLVQAVQK